MINNYISENDYMDYWKGVRDINASLYFGIHFGHNNASARDKISIKLQLEKVHLAVKEVHMFRIWYKCF